MATTTKTLPFDPAEHLTNPADQAELLTDALATGNAAYIANALGTIARARGMSDVARGAGVTREALYKSLNKKGDPKLTTFMGVLKTMKIQLTARAEPTGHSRKIGRTKGRPPARTSRAA
jgi:probable addiction module antidote protein